MSPVPLGATTFVLYERSPTRRALDVWNEIAADLIGVAPERYSCLSGRPYRLRLDETRHYSPTASFTRYRTIEVNLRFRRDAPALIDFALGNWVFAVADESTPLSTATIPDTKWVRAATSIALDEHIHWIREILLDLEDAGWAPMPAEFTPLSLPLPEIETSAGIRSYSPSGLSKLLGQSLWIPPTTSLAVTMLGRRAAITAHVAGRLASAWQRTFRAPSPPIQDWVDAPLQGAHSASLVVIPDNVDLAVRPDLREQIRTWENAGLKFKLARESTTAKQYPLQNLCFDLSILAGAIHWRPRDVSESVIAFDAGHDAIGRISRWACATVDHELQVASIGMIDTALGEHMPATISDAFWPTEDVRLILRDGRLAQERNRLDSRADSEHKVLWEVKKNPTALLYRGDFDQPSPAQFGDALVDPHGEVLLQTLPHGAHETIHPIRLRSTQANADTRGEVIKLLAHCAAPSLSMYQQARLPSAVYWADLASKLDQSGWSKVVGRGFGLVAAVP